MRVLMLTNCYTPRLGGVATAVQRLTWALRRRGHHVLVVAPQALGAPAQEYGVLRLPVPRQGDAGDFSRTVPLPEAVTQAVSDFAPDVIHAHQPFLLGESALRLGEELGLPVVYTHHTRHELYPAYAPASSPRARRLAEELAGGYAALCDAVIAPSDSTARLLRGRGVSGALEAIPTGVDVDACNGGKASAARERLELDERAFVVGHVGRLGPQKNLPFLAEALAEFLAHRPRTHFVCAGDGPLRGEMQRIFVAKGVEQRVHFTGALSGQALAELYQALDVFAFASHSETQAPALAEAMAAGVPAVAVDAPGVRELVLDGSNGRLLPEDHCNDFVAALDWVARQPPARKAELRQAARRTAEGQDLEHCTERTLALYRRVIAGRRPSTGRPQQTAAADWPLLGNVGRAARSALQAVRPGTLRYR